jgi:hypothetical protein
MIHKISSNKTLIYKCNTIKQYKEMLYKLYNYKTSKNRIPNDYIL